MAITETTAAIVAEKLAGYRINPRGKNYLVVCPAHDDSSPSLSIRDGDDRRLIVHCFAGCNSRDVLDAIRAKVGDIGTSAPQPKAAKGSSQYQRQQHEKAAWLWSQRRPIIGTAAEKYLRQVRGITSCPLPPTLAFLPKRKDHHPAMIAAFGLCAEPEPGIIAVPRDVVAVHLTKLRPDGTGKAEAEPRKIVVGSPNRKPITLAAANDLLGLAICEGVEDGLSVYQATGLGCWAAGSASFMPRLAEIVPSYVETITIFAHDDKAGQDGAHKLAAKLRARGIEVTIEGLAS